MATETVADRRLHPATIWLAILRQVIAPWLLPAAVFLVINLRSAEGAIRVLKWLPAAVMLVVIGGGFTAALAAISLRKFRYGVSERDIVIESGIFTRVRRNIPLSRVQDVGIEQGPLARLFGLAKVKIETGGGEKDEGVLDSISLADAERLRLEIRSGGNGAVQPDAETPLVAAVGGHKVFAMSLSRVLISGLFSFSLVYLAFAFAVIETLGDVIAFEFFRPSTWRRMAESASLQNLILLVFAVAVLGVVFGAGRTVMRDYGFTLWREGERFRRVRGLFTRSQVVVPLRRVQLARVKTGLIRRLFGWFELSLQTLGGAVEDASGRQSVAPFIRQGEIADILSEIGRFRLPAETELQRVSSRRLIKKLTPLVIPSLAALVVMQFVPFFGFVAAGLAIALVITALEWRSYRYGLVDGLLFVRGGLLYQRLWIAPPFSAQTVTLRRSMLQRWLGLATVVVDTAGGPAIEPLMVEDMSEERARALAEALRAQAKLV